MRSPAEQRFRHELEQDLGEESYRMGLWVDFFKLAFDRGDPEEAAKLADQMLTEFAKRKAASMSRRLPFINKLYALDEAERSKP